MNKAKKPIMVNLTKDKTYAWCLCGKSNKEPFCDGSHRVDACETKPLRFIADKDGQFALCGCKMTKNPPFCDGSHR